MSLWTRPESHEEGQVLAFKDHVTPVQRRLLEVLDRQELGCHQA